MKVIKTFCATILLLELMKSRLVYSYNFSTPDQWLWRAGGKSVPSSSEGQVLQSNVNKGSKWPNGIVPYKLHPSLTKTDMEQLKAAFLEYQSKTCVKFKSYKNGDPDYLSIEVNNNLCGKAYVCKKGGYQYAQFGGDCRDTKTMVHELGHALCLGHEHQRSDRDKYVTFIYCNQSDPDIPNKLKGYKVKGIYDYSSQMHYECGACTGGRPTTDYVSQCGPQKNPGLSVLDVDTINEMYNCQGCYRHRWIPIESMQESDKSNLYNFGFVDPFEGPLYPCRARLTDQIVIGKFEFRNKTCHTSWYGKEYRILENFEVLTIPGGLKNGDSEYSLVRVHNVEGTDKTPNKATFEVAVVAGEADEANGTQYGKGYVGYATVTDHTKQCKLEGPTADIDTIGKVFDFEKTYKQGFPLCHQEFSEVNNYFVLVCLNKNRLARFDSYRKWVVRHIKSINPSVVPGSKITMLGWVPADAKVFSIDLSKDRTDDNLIVFHFNPRFDWDGLRKVIVRNSRGKTRWGKMEMEGSGANFPFKKGSIFELEIVCEKTQFRVSVNGTSVVTFKYRLSLEDIKYLIVLGDVEVVEINGRNVQGEEGYYRRSFKNLETQWFGSSITLQPGLNDSSSEVSQPNPKSAKYNSTVQSAQREINHADVTNQASNSTNNNDTTAKGSTYFMFGIGFGIVNLVAITLGIFLGFKLKKKSHDYDGVSVRCTNEEFASPMITV